MKNIKSKKNIFIIVFLLVISSTIAFLYSTDTFQNIFVAASYKVVVTEEFVSPTNWVPGDTTPKTVTLKNEGTVPIKVRISYIEEWRDSNDNLLDLEHDGERVPIINFSNEDDYIYKDGYYYYDLPLEPGETTSSFIESVTFNPNYSGSVTCTDNNDGTHTCSSSDSSYEGGTYKLTLTIEGVQEDYYVAAWNLPRKVERPYLYNVLKYEAEENGLAKKYTGSHHDSFTEEPSKDIYHWYATTNKDRGEVLNKINVVFANHCWQMVRTTDTGGVKMIYNGEVENNQCLDTRGNHVGYFAAEYASGFPQNLNNNYWYGTDYTYDSSNNLFSITGTTEQKNWNATNAPSLIGKYTCKSTNENATCSKLFLIESYYSASQGYVLPLNSNIKFSTFGTLFFNRQQNSPTYVGYKYGDVYSYSSTNGSTLEKFVSTEIMLQSASLGTSYWYADSIDYDNNISNKYSLVDAYQVSGTDDYQNLVGKYTFRNATYNYTNTNVYYIAGVDGSTMYYKQLSGSNLLTNYEPILFGDSLTDNGDGTYTLNNPISVTLSDWYTNYASYNNKYTCNNSSNICTSPRYITATTSIDYSYINAGEIIMIGKSRSGTTLVDTLLLSKYEFIKNRSSYTDYKYTCNTETSICTEATLRMINSITENGYTYAPNHYYGSSVTWDGTNYTLVDPIEMENYNNLNNISTHHYICTNYGEKVCTTVGYVFYYNGSGTMNYVTLKNGITTISKVLEDMLTKNTNDSTIKLGTDSWYKHYLLDDYDDYIEDTIFCNDRSIRQFGGWNDNGGMTNEYLKFKEYNVTSDLSCTNNSDRFSINNNDALLDYKVGLLSSPEINILNQISLSSGWQSFWLGSPIYSFGYGNQIRNRRVELTGKIGETNVTEDEGFRPVISLKPGIEYSSGDGSMANPYIVDTD